MKRFLIPALAVPALLFAGLALPGCNMFSSFDEPSSDEEIVEQALTDMDNGKCDDAIKLFQGRATNTLSDNAAHTLGWAQLCAGGATLTSVAKSLFSYSTTSNNTAILGTLANALIPQSDLKIQSFDNAIATFGNIKDGNIRSVNTVMARLVKIAAVLAKSAGNSGDSSTLTRADIGPCTAGCATCAEGASAAMSDTDAALVGTTITNAVSAQVPGMGSVGDLTGKLGTTFPTGSADDAYRCQIYLNLLSN